MNNTKQLLLALAEAEEHAANYREAYAIHSDAKYAAIAMRKKAEKLRDIADRFGDDEMNSSEQNTALQQGAVSGAKRKLVCPNCGSEEENHKRMGNHAHCCNCEYEWNWG